MQLKFLVFTLVLTILADGCVILPVPLTKTENVAEWDGMDGAGNSAIIMAKVKTWYLPMVASPEGSQKIGIKDSSYTYFISNAGAKLDPGAKDQRRFI